MSMCVSSAVARVHGCPVIVEGPACQIWWMFPTPASKECPVQVSE